MTKIIVKNIRKRINFFILFLELEINKVRCIGLTVNNDQDGCGRIVKHFDDPQFFWKQVDYFFYHPGDRVKSHQG